MLYDKKVLGVAIKSARFRNRLTQEQLAEKVGVAPSHIKQIEAGNRNPSVEVLYKLAVTLNFSIDEIFFPDRKGDQELIREIDRSLQQCTLRDLHVVYSTLAALKENREE